MYENIEDSFRFFKPDQVHEPVDVGHGRVEKRKWTILSDLGHIEQLKKWKDIQVLIKIEKAKDTLKSMEK